MVGKEKLSDIVVYNLINGEEKTLIQFNLNKETYNRYMREARKQFGEGLVSLTKLKDQYTDDELLLMAKGARPNPHNTQLVHFEGKELTFGIMSDMHIGSIYSNPAHILSAIEEFNKQKVDMVLCPGDLVDGMMGRPGDVYELTHIGYKAQRDEAVRLLKNVQAPFYTISGNHDCLNPDTECLTKRGWLKYSEIRQDDEVFSYDTKNDCGVWSHISSILIKEIDDELLNANVRGFSFSGTKNHRVLFRKWKSEKQRFTDWGYKPAIDSFAHGTVIKTASTANNKDYPIQDDMIRLVAWLLTDGGIQRDKETQTGTYTIYQSKLENIPIILGILDRLGLSYTHSIRDRNITHVCGKELKKKPLPEQNFRLKVESATLVKEWIYDKKSFPKWLFNLSDRQFDIFIEEVKRANGSAHRDSSSYMLTGKYESLNEFQILCATHNRRSTLVMDNRGDWRLNISDNNSIELRDVDIQLVPYRGIVWCLSVPLTNFMVRRNGRVYFTGNCSYTSKHGTGANIVEDICSGLGENFHYLGHDEADLEIEGIRIRLFHGGDGSSYALSYRGQKLIEAINGGNKPNIMITGHIHKCLYMFYRNIHYIDAGALQMQSSWMRGKKLQAHVGFWICKAKIQDGEVKSFTSTWFPIYV